jgi:hypothetical protein
MQGEVEDKTQSKIQNLGNESEIILAVFSYSLVHIFK